MSKIFKLSAFGFTFIGTLIILYLNHYNGSTKVVVGLMPMIGFIGALKWLSIRFDLEKFCNKEGLVYDKKRDMQIPKSMYPILKLLWKYKTPLFYLSVASFITYYAEKNMQTLFETSISILILFALGLLCDYASILTKKGLN